MFLLLLLSSLGVGGKVLIGKYRCKRHNFDYMILGLVVVCGTFFAALAFARMNIRGCKSLLPNLQLRKRVEQ